MRNSQVIDTLKEEYRVLISHRRPLRSGEEVTRHELDVRGLNPSAWDMNGGSTTVILCDKDTGDILAKGVARCSEFDSFNKRLGLTIALGRALHSLKGN